MENFTNLHELFSPSSFSDKMDTTHFMCLQSLLNFGNHSNENNTSDGCGTFMSNSVFVGIHTSDIGKPAMHTFGRQFISYLTPLILVVGLIGNGLSVIVFRSHKMRHLSASIYLATLAVADTCALLFYVLPEWLRRGLVHIDSDVESTFLDRNGLCQISLYLSYVSRLMSTWTLVAFTIERFTGVCYPLKAIDRNSKKILTILLVTALVIPLYKPALSGEYTLRGKTACGPDPRWRFASFVLDSMFGLSITLLPFLIITVLNILITKQLFLRNSRPNDLFAENTKIRLEFTIILLAISFFFVAFNVPYFTVWARNFISSSYVRQKHDSSDLPKDTEHWNGILNVTRTIFYLNYSVNFFLYNITGAYFRAELVKLFRIRRRRRRVYESSLRFGRLGSSRMTSSGSCQMTYVV